MAPKLTLVFERLSDGAVGVSDEALTTDFRPFARWLLRTTGRAVRDPEAQITRIYAPRWRWWVTIALLNASYGWRGVWCRLWAG